MSSVGWRKAWLPGERTAYAKVWWVSKRGPKAAAAAAAELVETILRCSGTGAVFLIIFQEILKKPEVENRDPSREA